MCWKCRKHYIGYPEKPICLHFEQHLTHWMGANFISQTRDLGPPNNSLRQQAPARHVGDVWRCSEWRIQYSEPSPCRKHQKDTMCYGYDKYKYAFKQDLLSLPFLRKPNIKLCSSFQTSWNIAYMSGLAVVHLALFWKMYVGGGLSTANSSYGEKNHLV